jgi:DNA-binding transcriptional MerR regulator
MSDQDKEESSLKPIRQKANQWGVSVRTVHRWAESGIIDPLERINGRNYLPGDAEPRRDGKS